MKFWYVESQKPTREERSWVIGMTEAGFKINNVAFHFDIHKTIAFRIINRFVQTKLAGDRPRSGRRIKTNSAGGTFHSDHINTGDISCRNPALYNMKELSLVRKCPPKLSKTVSDARGECSKYWHFVFLKNFLWQALRSLQMKFCSIWYWIRLLSHMYCKKSY